MLIIATLYYCDHYSPVHTCIIIFILSDIVLSCNLHEQTKILCRQLNCSVKLADVSIFALRMIIEHLVETSASLPNVRKESSSNFIHVYIIIINYYYCHVNDIIICTQVISWIVQKQLIWKRMKVKVTDRIMLLACPEQ